MDVGVDHATRAELARSSARRGRNPAHACGRARLGRPLYRITAGTPDWCCASASRDDRGDGQIQALLAQSRALADVHDDVSFTPPYLSTIRADTLIVFGDSDPLYPASLAFDLHAAVPRSRLWIVPGGGHAPVFGEHAARFAETALRFLMRPAPATSGLTASAG